MTIDWIQIAVSILLGSSIFLLVWSVFRVPVQEDAPLHRRFAAAMGVDQRPGLFTNPLMAPIMTLGLIAAQRLNAPMIRRHLRQNLDASGNPNSYSVEEYLALCMFAGLALAVVAGFVALVFLGQLDLLTVTGMGFLGFWAPIWALKEAATKRVMRISKQVPYTLDLVALMMGAGSTFAEAVNSLIRDNPSDDFNQELRIVLAEMDLGTRRSLALANLAQRIPLDSLRSVVGAVNQAESLGTPLSSILKGQADMMRNHRSVRAEKLAASASLRILFPSMLILLAVILFVFGPMIIRYARGELLQ